MNISSTDEYDRVAEIALIATVTNHEGRTPAAAVVSAVASFLVAGRSGCNWGLSIGGAPAMTETRYFNTVEVAASGGVSRITKIPRFLGCGPERTKAARSGLKRTRQYLTYCFYLFFPVDSRKTPGSSAYLRWHKRSRGEAGRTRIHGQHDPNHGVPAAGRLVAALPGVAVLSGCRAAPCFSATRTIRGRLWLGGGTRLEEEPRPLCRHDAWCPLVVWRL